jgi:hypothetical protein
MNDTPRTDAIRKQYARHLPNWLATDVFCPLAERLERELTAVTAQRDRLAEALRPFIAGWCDKSCDSVVTERQFRDAKQALADLALAAVKGGSDE